MSGAHIVLFNRITAGMTYRLYALPKFYVSRCEAEANGGENTLLQAVLFAPGGLDVDFPLTWRPATMYNAADDTYVAISNIPFIVVTYEYSTRLFVLPEFVPTTKYDRIDVKDDDGRSILPPPEKMLFPEPAIDLPYMHKQDYADHVRITSGFDAAFMVWLDHKDDWMVMSTRYDEHHAPPVAYEHTGEKASRAGDNCRNVGRYGRRRRPRKLGNGDVSHTRLCLSPMSGTAFHTTRVDRSAGVVHMWEWLVPPQHDVANTVRDNQVMEAFGFDVGGFGVPLGTTNYDSR